MKTMTYSSSKSEKCGIIVSSAAGMNKYAGCNCSDPFGSKGILTPGPGKCQSILLNLFYPYPKVASKEKSPVLQTRGIQFTELL
jgi:hypothetical protein